VTFLSYLLRARKVLVQYAALIVCGTALLPQAQGQVIALTDSNAAALIDVGSQQGLFHLGTASGNLVNQQWFWYRIGTNGPEVSIDTISTPIITLPDARTTFVTYNNGSFGVEVDYLLTAQPGSGFLDISQMVIITNDTRTPIEFHLFKYSDLDAAGYPGGDTVQLGTNIRGLFNEAAETSAVNSLIETVVTPGANRAEVGFLGQTLTKLNNNGPDNLDNTRGPLGPGDVTYAMQWDLIIPPTNSVGLSFDLYFQGSVPPTIAPIPDRIVSVGQLVSFTNVAHGDHPPFYFRIGSFNIGPPGASVNATNGVFRWRPTMDQAGTTNLIKIVVDDAYMPVGWATQSFTVVVRDYVQVAAGSTALGEGESGSVPITAFSTAGLTNLSFDFALPPDSLTNPVLTSIASAIGASSLSQLSNGLWHVSLSTAPGQFLQGTQVVTSLGFTSLSGQASAFVPLGITNVAGLRSGALLADMVGSAGRVAVLGEAPLMDIDRPAAVTLYGDPGAQYSIEYRPGVASGGNWSELTRITLTARSAPIAISPGNAPSRFYRARKL
jgi:hypothetical protein